MLRNTYAPTDFKSINQDPTISTEDKLRTISNSLVQIVPQRYQGKPSKNLFFAQLPFRISVDFMLGTHDNVYIDTIDLGDNQLYGHGIGTRLVQVVGRFAIDSNPRTTRFSTGWARLGMVNTAIRAFGEENVCVQQNATYYGWGSERPLEVVFDDFPPKQNEAYLVEGIEARIDHAMAETWEHGEQAFTC